MKTFLGISTLMLLVVLLAAPLPFAPALGEDVASKRNPQIDLSGARTYAWKPAPELSEDNPLAAGAALDGKLREAVEKELAQAGLEPAGTAEPDLWIIYYVNVDNRLQIAEFDYHVGDWLDFQTELEDQQRRIRQYEQGTVVVDVIDADSQELAWSGWMTSVAPSIGELRRKAERKIRKAIHKMFRDFPSP